MQPSRPDVETTPYLTFRVAEEEYAVPVLRVREIIEHGVVTRVPSTPAWIRGVINLRGGVVPVVDLGLRLGLPERPLSKRSCIVIVELPLQGETALVGVTADAVNQVQEIRPQDVEPVPAFGTPLDLEFLVGMARSGPAFVMLLDIDRLLAAEMAGARSAVEAAAEPVAEAEGA